VITLHGFGPFFGTPDSSPFVIKVMMLLKLAGVPIATCGEIPSRRLDASCPISGMTT